MKKCLTLLSLLLLHFSSAMCLPNQMQQVLTSNENISANLYAVNIDGSISLQDGALTLYDPAYNNAVDLNDFRKLNNFAENIAIQKTTAMLAIEKRQPVNLSDTLFLKMWQMLQKPYRLEIVANNMNHPGLVAYLEDSYLNTSTPISLTGTTLVNFSINSVPASADFYRFRIVFRTPGAIPLAVDINSFKTILQNDRVNIEWAVTGAAGTNQYVLEKSSDGSSFQALVIFTNAGNAATYKWTDIYPVTGINYYRIKTVQNNGQASFGPIQKVAYLKSNAAITVFPNPVTGNSIALQINNLPKGTYTAGLSNSFGQIVSNETINYQGANSVQNIVVSKTLPNGIYQLKVYGQGIQPQTIKVLIQSK